MLPVFISHSKDDPNLDVFHRALSGVQPIWMEYETIEKPEWKTIAQKVDEASSMFVILNKILDDDNYQHTRNWVAFEVGLACKKGINVWVFEPIKEKIDFVVPYFTHHCKFVPDKENVDEIKFLKTIFGLLGELSTFEAKWSLKYKTKCPNCEIEFIIFPTGGEFTCPACRTHLEIIMPRKSLSDFV